MKKGGQRWRYVGKMEICKNMVICGGFGGNDVLEVMEEKEWWYFVVECEKMMALSVDVMEEMVERVFV